MTEITLFTNQGNNQWIEVNNEAITHDIQEVLEKSLKDYWNKKDLYTPYQDYRIHNSTFQQNLDMLKKTQGNAITKEFALFGYVVEYYENSLIGRVPGAHHRIAEFLYRYYRDDEMNAIDHLEDFDATDIQKLSRRQMNYILKNRPEGPTVEKPIKPAEIQVVPGIWRPNSDGVDDLSQEISEDLIFPTLQYGIRSGNKERPVDDDACTVDELEEDETGTAETRKLIQKLFELSEDEDEEEPECAFSPVAPPYSPLTSIEDWSVTLREEEEEPPNPVEFTATLPSVEELFKELYPKCKRPSDFEKHDQGTWKKYKESG